MSIKLILVPLSGQPDASASDAQDVLALETAFRLGKITDARVRVILIEPPRTDTSNKLAPWLPAYGLDEVFGIVDVASEQRREQALQSFNETMKRLKAPLVSDQGKQGFAVEFLERIGDVQHSLATHGKLADLIVVAQSSKSASTSNSLMLNAALRETARPVLIATGSSSGKLGEHIAIAWNGSSEATRAVAMTLPMLASAKRVTVIAVQENGEINPCAQELADYLRLHDIDSSTVTIDGTAHGAGKSILEETKRSGADMLVMGAYSHNRARMLVFGGATSHILKATTVPVVMVH